MSRRTQDLFFGLTGQSLVLDCPDGRPTSVTSVTVYASGAGDTGTVEFTASGTIESNPNTTVDLASGASETDPTLVYVAATTGAAVGRRYLLASARGHIEWIEVADIASADYVVSKYPLVNDYAVSDTLKTTRITAPVDAAWVAELGNLSPAGTANPGYRVRWILVVGGVTKTYQTDVDLVRYEGRHHVTPLDVAERAPNWIDYLPPDSRARQGQDRIDEAYRLVIGDLYADKVPDQLLRNGEAVDALVIERTLMLTGGENVYRQRYDQFFRSGTPITTDESGGGGAVEVTNRAPLWRR